MWGGACACIPAFKQSMSPSNRSSINAALCQHLSPRLPYMQIQGKSKRSPDSTTRFISLSNASMEILCEINRDKPEEQGRGRMWYSSLVLLFEKRYAATNTFFIVSKPFTLYYIWCNRTQRMWILYRLMQTFRSSRCDWQCKRGIG